MLAKFPNMRFFPCLDPRCHQLVDLLDVDIEAASVRLDTMSFKAPLETVIKSYAKLVLSSFCSKHRKEPMHENEIMAKAGDWKFAIKSLLKERGKETTRDMEVRESNKAEKQAMQEEESEVTRLSDEVNGLKEQLQRALDENGTMSKKISQLQKQVSEMERAKNDLESTNTVHAREKGRLESEMEKIKKIAVWSREVRIKEVIGLKVQLQDSGAQVEEAARHIGALKGQLEESNARLESIKQETSEDIRELNDQLHGERKMTMELNELTNRLKETNTRFEESESDQEIMEQQTIVELNELRDQLDKSNASLGDMRQGSTTEANELKDQLKRCKDIIAEPKAAGRANIVQRACEVDRCNDIFGDCPRVIACHIAGLHQHLIDRDEVPKQLKAKRVRLLEDELKKEKVRTSVMIGVAAILAIAYVHAHILAY